MIVEFIFSPDDPNLVRPPAIPGALAEGMALEPSLVIVRAHDAPITSAAYCRPRLWTGCEGGLIKCWEEKTGTCVKILDGHGGGWVTDLLYSPSHRYLLSCGLDGGLLCWSDKGKVVQRAEQTTPLYCMAYCARNNQLAVGGHAVVHVFALRAVARSSSFVDDDAGPRTDAAVVHLTSVRDAHDDIVRAIRCDAVGSGAFYTAGYDRAVCAFDPETLDPASRDKPHVRGKPRFRRFPNLHDAPIVSLDLDQDNGWIVTGSLDGTVRVFTRDARCLNSFERDGVARVLSVARLPGASAYLSAGVAEDGDETRAVISCFDARTPLELTERVADACGFVKYPASRLTRSEHDPDVVVGSIRARDPRERYDAVVWRFNPDASFRVHAKAHEDWIEALCAVPQPPGAPEVVYSAGGDARITRWRGSGAMNTDAFTPTEAETPAPGAPRRGICCACYCDALGMLATGTEDGAVRLWEIPDAADDEDDGASIPEARFRRRRDDHDDDDDDDEYPSGGDDEYQDSDGDFTDGAVGSSGREANHAGGTEMDAYGERDHLRRDLLGHEGRVAALVELGDHVLASAGADCSIRYWDLHTRLEMHRADRAHDTPVHALRRAPSREEFASAAADSAVKIWSDHHPFALRGVLAGHSGDVTAVEWCQWGRDAWITAADDRTFRLWDPDTGATLRTLAFRGDVVTAACVDAANRCFLAATADAVVRVYDASQLTGDEQGDDAVDDEADEGKENVAGDAGDASIDDAAKRAAAPTRSTADPSRPSRDARGDSSVAYVNGVRVDDHAVARATFRGHTDAVRAIAHLPRRRQYVTAGCDGSLRVWLAPNHPGRAGGAVPPRPDVELEAWERRRGGFESAFERGRPLETPLCLQFEDPVTKMLAKEAERAAADAGGEAEREEARARAAEEEARTRQARTSLGRRLAEIEAADAAERPLQ